MNKTEYQELIQIQKDSDYLKKSYDALKKQFSNQFIAIKEGGVIAHHPDMNTVLKMIQEKKIDPATVLIEFLHPKDMILIL
jgi:polyphosphate kinase